MFVASDGDGKVQWRITDKVALPADMTNKFVRHESCRYNESFSKPVVAVVSYYDRSAPQFVKAAGWAYQVELPAGNFVEINADGVDCLAQVGED